MTILRLEPAPEEDTWNDETLKFFLRSDFPNTVYAFQSWIDLFDTGTIMEDVVWENIGKSRLLTVEEYAANLNKNLEIVELKEVLREFQQLAIRGNTALAQKNLEALRLVIKKYYALFTKLFPNFGEQAGMVLMDPTIIR